VKVVEGSRIYNFPIHHILHFYSKILRKIRSNSASPTRGTRPALPALPRAHPGTPPCATRLTPAPCASMAARTCRSTAHSHRSPLLRAALMPRRLGTPRRHTNLGLPRGPSAVAGYAHSRGTPVHPLVARRSLCPYKGVAAPFSDAQTPPPPTKPPPAPSPPPEQPRRAPVSRSAVSPQRSPPPSSTLTAAHRPVHLDQASPARRERQPRRPHSLAAGEQLAGATTALSNTPNRAPLAPRPFSHPSPVMSGGELAGIEQPAPAGRSQGLHRETPILSGGFTAKG
jgi:hypothetical protein